MYVYIYIYIYIYIFTIGIYYYKYMIPHVTAFRRGPSVTAFRHSFPKSRQATEGPVSPGSCDGRPWRKGATSDKAVTDGPWRKAVTWGIIYL